MKMTLIGMKMKLHAELIFIWKVSYLDSFWNRGARDSEMVYYLLYMNVNDYIIGDTLFGSPVDQLISVFN